jgi:hypothetical protein
VGPIFIPSINRKASNMKLRCSANSIRFRVQEEDLRELSANHSVSVLVKIPPGKGLRYTLALVEVAEISVAFEYDEVLVRLPKGAALQWINTEQVGMETTVFPDIKVLIEKDFPCGHVSLPPKA